LTLSFLTMMKGSSNLGSMIIFWESDSSISYDSSLYNLMDRTSSSSRSCFILASIAFDGNWYSFRKCSS
jgi:hypothetical protein